MDSGTERDSGTAPANNPSIDGLGFATPTEPSGLKGDPAPPASDTNTDEFAAELFGGEDPNADGQEEFELDEGDLELATFAPPPLEGSGELSVPGPQSTGFDDVVLAEIDANASERPTDEHPTLGYAEDHDAWTRERMSRQSTVPPEAAADVNRLRELSAQRVSMVPDAAWRGGALDLVDQSRPSQEVSLLDEMEELYALDDLTGALRCAELVLGQDPDNDQAQRCAENCRERLLQLYASKLGDMHVPVELAIDDSELRWLGLDHRSGFLLSRVDGLSTVEELLDICGMPRLEALKALVDLFERGAIRLVDG